MARFRKKRSRRSYGFFKRKSRRSGSSGISATDVMIAGAVYGFGRPIVANMVPPMFEFGPVDSDNAIIGAASFMGMKQRNKLIRAISTVALAGEIAQVVAKMTSGSTSNGTVNY